MRTQDNKYFAAQNSDQVAASLLSKANMWLHQLDTSGYLWKLRESWKCYHGAFYGGDGHKILFGGEQGEIAHLPVNHFRNIAENIIVMITANRPSMTARATNTDYKSLVQTSLANGLLDYYMREKRLERYLITAVKFAVVMGSGFIKMEWNATAGEVADYDEDTGEPIYEGDLQFTNLSPFDVFFDSTKEGFNLDWVVCRTFKNRYDLAAKFPELKDKIINLPTKSDIYKYRFDIMMYDETDDVPVYEFFHKKTEALPEGRYLLFLDSDVTLLDGPMPYRELPIYRIAPSDILGTPYGYTSMFDILPIQDAMNSLYSTILTNQQAFGIQNVYVPRGADIVTSQLAGGLNLLEGNPAAGKPEALNLTQTPKEIFEFMKVLERAAETISGVNSVARGNPEANLRSGSAIALVQSMALQFMSGLQQSYVQLIEDVGTGMINILKDYAAVPRVAAIVGESNATYLKEFSGDDLSLVNRVLVDMGNALAQTKAGRIQMADNLLQYGMGVTPEMYVSVMNTGKLDVLTETTEKELMLIRRENERLVQNLPVIAMSVDRHIMHIKEHKAVLADPDLRFDPELVKRTLDHIQEHITELQQVDPFLLQVIGETPAPPPAAEQNATPMPQMAETAEGTDIQGMVNQPQQAQVDPSLLPNPELQEQSMGNVRNFNAR